MCLKPCARKSPQGRSRRGLAQHAAGKMRPIPCGCHRRAQSDQEGRFYKGQGAVQAHCLNCSMGAPFVLLHVRADPHCFADYEACGLQSRPLQHCMLRPDKHYSCEISASTASTLATLHLTTSQPGCPARHLGAAPCRGSLVAA